MPVVQPLSSSALHRSLAFVAALGLTALLAGCAAGDTTTRDEAAEAATAMTTPQTLVTALPRPVAFSTWNETLVDTSRPTEAGATTPAFADRTLVTTLYLPDTEGPAPLIVFSHGLDGHPDKFTELLSAWAAAGYVVAAPAFPLTNSHVAEASKNASDLVSQPGDARFVLDEVLRLASDPASRLFGRVDADRIGAGGLSLGGATTYALVYGDCCRDDRIKAAEVLAGGILPALEGPIVLDGHAPLLIVHGDADPAVRYSFATDAFAQASPPTWFVTLLGGSHATPFENAVTPYDSMVERLTVGFWDATIGGDSSSYAAFEVAATVPGLSTLQAK